MGWGCTRIGGYFIKKIAGNTRDSVVRGVTWKEFYLWALWML